MGSRTEMVKSVALVLCALLGSCIAAPLDSTASEESAWSLGTIMSVSLVVVITVGMFCCGSSSKTSPQPQVVVRAGPTGAPLAVVVHTAPISEPNPGWVSQVTIKGDPAMYGWDNSKMSNMLLLVDPFTVMKVSTNRGSAGVMTKAAFKKGKHMFEIYWPKVQRGNNSSIGVARASMALENPKPITLVGETSKSTGYDLVRKKSFKLGKPLSNNNYPAAALGVDIPDTFTMLLDADTCQVYFGQLTGTWGSCFSYKYVDDEPVHIMAGVTFSPGVVKIYYKGSVGSGAENAGADIPGAVAPGSLNTVNIVTVKNPVQHYGKVHCPGQPLWISDLVAASVENLGWGQRDPTMIVLEDGEKILYMASSDRYTAGARLKMGMTSGKHVFEILWPANMRGRFATVGIATASHPLCLNQANSFIGEKAGAYGLDIVRRRVVAKNSKATSAYPKVTIPEQFYMYVDLDTGVLSFGSELEYWETAFSDVKRGEEYFVIIGACHNTATVTVRNRGQSRPMEAAVQIHQVPTNSQPAPIATEPVMIQPSAPAEAPPAYDEEKKYPPAE